MSIGSLQNGHSASPRFDQSYTAVTARDLRADGRRRQILLCRDRVTIERSFCGIAMRLSVPVATYRGVCVGLRQGPGGEFLYQVRLEHRDPDLSVLLAEAPDDSETWAEWRGWARYFNLPALIERNEGLAVWGPNPGLSSAKAAARRRTKRRRPGFLARRFTRRTEGRVVHREPELITWD